MAVPIQLWQFTVSDYDRMRESGILGEDDRVELIDGEVREMSPIGDRHAGIVNRLTHLLVDRVGRQAIVSVQNPIVLDDFTKPQPDLVLLRRQDDFYVTRPARPDDILLVIEVADTTLDYDRTEKMPWYAASGISELWIVDVFGQSIEQYTDLQTEAFQRMEVLKHGQTIRCLTLPELSLEVSAILG